MNALPWFRGGGGGAIMVYPFQKPLDKRMV